MNITAGGDDQGLDEAVKSGSPEALLAWYDRVGRSLPWRSGASDPYRVVVSEVMLQQTRAETVAGRFGDFLERFPDLEELAASREEDVVAAWSGLGYYRRARNLWRLAREVRSRGSWPRTPEGLRELPGVGEYTAAAVASIAFGEVVPVVDGNVERVFARRLALEDDPKRAASRRRIRAAAAAWVSADRPGDSNQALMEVGAVVCTPRSPRCDACPMREGCLAAAGGQAERYPRRPVRAAPRKIRLEAVPVLREGRFLLFRRSPDEALVAGTWEVPWAPRGASDAETEGSLAGRYGGTWILGRVAGTVRHAITDRRFEVRVRQGERTGEQGVEEGVEARWVTRTGIDDLPISSLVTKVLAVAVDDGEVTRAGRPGRRRG